MIRELFHLGPLSISPFGVLMVAAFFAAFFQLRWGLRHLRAGDDEDASAIVFWAGVGGILGGKVYYACLYGDWQLLLDRAGIVWYGGLIGGALFVVGYLRRRQLSLVNVCDAIGPALALGYAVGRIGCFLVGDDYGRPTDLPWGQVFAVGLPPTTAGDLRQQFAADLPASIADDQLIAVHPTQLYETLLGLMIWAIGWWLLRRRPWAGAVLWTVLALMASERFGIEFLRLKDDRFLGPLTLAQGISLLIIGLAGVMLWRQRAQRAA